VDSNPPDGPVPQGIRQEVQRRVQQLTNFDSEVRREACTTLGILGRSEAVYPLINVLDDKDPEVADAAAHALARLGPPALSPLLRTLQNRSLNVRRNGAVALGELGDRRALESLIAVLHEDTEASHHAAVALGKLGDERAVPALITALRAHHHSRVGAAIALGQLNCADAVPALIHALADREPNVQAMAAGALGKLGDARALPALHALQQAYANDRWNRSLYQAVTEAVAVIEARGHADPP
jgi:HEAT repeat protein